MNQDVTTYNSNLNPEDKAICDLLANEICKVLPKSTHRLWHGQPVWYLNGNPILGYKKLMDGIKLVFWSGQSFGESGLQSEGVFKAAGKVFLNLSEICIKDLRNWLKKAEAIQWDYKNLVRKNGVLELISRS